MQEALFLNKKISEMVKRGKTIFKSKIKWILALILLTGCIYGSYTLSRYTEADQVEAKQAQVILDAGHGGSDPGKIGLNNLLEKDINLAIAKKLKVCLEKAGFEQIRLDLGISKRIYTEKDEFYNPTPLFCIAATKNQY